MWCVRDEDMFFRIFVVVVLHICVHLALLRFAIPMLAVKHEASDTEYSEVDAQLGRSWFTANPVHCLRSKYVHHHSPPCQYFAVGKEELLQKNPEIGCFFDG